MGGTEIQFGLPAVMGVPGRMQAGYWWEKRCYKCKRGPLQEPSIEGRTGETGRSQDKTDAGHGEAGEGNKFGSVCSQARKAEE